MEKDSIGRRWGGWTALLALLLVTAVAANSNNPTANSFFTISQLCEDSFMKQHSRKIEGAVVIAKGERNMNCELTFQTESILQRFMLRFERLQLDCNDHLNIYDGAYAHGDPKEDLSCRNSLKNAPTIYTQSNHVTLRYRTDMWGKEENGFRLLITAFKDKKHTCLHFRCETTNYCVDRELTCDGVNHCGDGSDESTSLAQCPSPPLVDILGSSAVLVTFASLAASLFLACAVAVGFCIYRRHRANRAQRAHQPNMYAYPTVEIGGQYGTNGTFSTHLVEKPPPYPGAPQHTSVIPPGSNSGNLVRPAFGVGCNMLRQLTSALYFPCL